jgi:hypothetical protein
MKNFINEDSLRALHPRISDYIGKGRVDFSFQIGEAFRQTIDALRARGFKVRTLSKPLDLLRPYQSTTVQNFLTSSGALTAAKDFDFIEGIDGFNRFVVSISAATFGAKVAYIFTLEGSDDQGVDSASPPTTWRTLATLTAKSTGDFSARFDEETKWYRVRVAVSSTVGEPVDSEGTPAYSVTFTSWLQETSVERLTMYRALALIMASFSVDPADVWSQRAAEANSAFDTALKAISVNVDLDEDNVPTESEKKSGLGVTFSR